MSVSVAKALVCEFCGCENDPEHVDMDAERGFWCEFCDGYTYLVKTDERHRFTLLLEDKQQHNDPPPKCSVRFNKRISPLRYPGGKSKFVPFVYDKMRKNGTQRLVSPFTGGGSVEFALLHAGVVKKMVLNDLDFGVYSLFETIRRDSRELIHRIETTKLTHDDFYNARAVVKSGYQGSSMNDAAWALLVTNRLAYSGIYKANPLGGRDGGQKELLARWNPATLISRIQLIHSMRDRFIVLNTDACTLIETAYWYPDTTLFIDPPYVAKGKQLYRHYYDSNEHVRLNVLLDYLHQGMPGADIILCYDNDPWIEQLYIFPTIEKISRVYSV